MAALNTIAREYADEIRDGIAWVIVWKTGRSWNATAAWLDTETDTFEPDDLNTAREVLAQDPRAVMLNGYYCGHLGEGMAVAELAAGIRWHYENGCNTLDGSTAFPPETAPASLQALQDGINRAVQTLQKFGERLLETMRTATQTSRESVDKLVDALLYKANDHPKWWHLYKYTKKARTRKKYRRRLMQQLITKLAAAGG